MKKTLKIILFSCFIGTTLAGLFFLNVKDKAEAKNRNIVYAFQVGAFKNRENANNLSKKYPMSKIIYDQEYYRVYIGVTCENQEILKNNFDKENYRYYLKELEVEEQIINEIKKYDALYLKTSEENQNLVLKSMLESLPNEL